MSIPLFVLEEHHEAFIAWHRGLRNGDFQPGCRNTLLHVDAHSDFRVFPYSREIPPLMAPLAEIGEFTYGDLTISSFIVPAIYQKLFYEVCWLVPRHLTQDKGSSADLNRKRYFYVAPYKGNTRTLITRDDPFEGFWDQSREVRIPFCQYTQTVETPFCGSEASVLLDIDLDYFCCAPIIDNSERLEITRDEYLRCESQIYRKLNLHYRRRLHTSNGRYYLCLNPRSDLVDDYKPDLERALESISEFLQYLKSSSVVPALVTLCRSRHSGYTPESIWARLEEELIRGLGSLYALGVKRAALPS